MKTSTCPDESVLKKLAVADLGPDEIEPLLAHVQECDACLAKLPALSGTDTLVDAVAKTKTLCNAADDPLLVSLMSSLAKLSRSPAPAAPGAGDGSKVKIILRQATDATTGFFSGGPEQVTTTEGGRGPSQSADTERLEFLAPPQQSDEIGRLGHYRILKKLGAGGMGMVFLGEDTLLQRKAAIKVMLPQFAASATSRERFLREARSAASIEHEHIVPIFQVGEDNGVPFLAMPFLKGEPLDVCLDREGKLPLPQALRIAREMAEGLAAAHANSLIHRDIKPGNVWLEGKQGKVRLLDFGLARAQDDTTNLTSPGALVGTPAFMAPEQAKGNKIDVRADLFSLGCVLYLMLTGQRPFRGNDTLSLLMSLAMETPDPPTLANPEVPDAVSELTMRLLAKEAADRPESAEAVAEAVRALEASAVQPTPAGSAPQAPRRRAPLVVAAVALLLALGGGGYWLSQTVIIRDKDGNKVAEIQVPGGGSVQIKENRGPPPKNESIATVSPKATGPLRAKFQNALGMEFALIPKGKSWLGGGKDKPGGKEVVIPKDFYLGVYEVTQEEWERVTGSNPSIFKAGHQDVAGVPPADQKRFPVENVSWDDCQEFIKQLNEQVKETGWEYRLPTAAEWEYACRGGPLADKADSAFDFYLEKPTNTLLPAQANFKQSALNRTCKVGSYQPNRLGLYDMHGNVWEWCLDETPGKASERVNRGGDWYNVSSYSSAANRFGNQPSFRDSHHGLRLARVPVDPNPKKDPMVKVKP